jgi:hypothetical protein
MYAIFNLDKNFLSYSDQEMGLNFLSLKIPEEKTNLLEWGWSGNYDNGEMVKLENSEYVDVHNENSFEYAYPFHSFMSIILKQLYITSKKNNTLTEEYKDLTKHFIHSFETPEIYLELLRYTNKI